MQFLLLKSFHPFCLCTICKTILKAEYKCMSLQRVQISDMLNALQVIFKNCMPIGPLHCHLFFKSKYSDSSLPSTAPNYKASLNELKLRRTTPTRKRRYESSISLRFRIPPHQNQHLGKG